MALTAPGMDLIAYDKRSMPVLLVETKTNRDPSPDWAAKYRRNILEHDWVPPAPYFLIATPSQLYFWHQEEGVGELEMPHFVVNAGQELKGYFEQFGSTPEAIGPEAFDWLLEMWLNDMARPTRSPDRREQPGGWMADSGLAEALRNARIELNPER